MAHCKRTVQRRKLPLLIALIFGLVCIRQFLLPVKWKYSLEAKNDVNVDQQLDALEGSDIEFPVNREWIVERKGSGTMVKAESVVADRAENHITVKKESVGVEVPGKDITISNNDISANQEYVVVDIRGNDITVNQEYPVLGISLKEYTDKHETGLFNLANSPNDNTLGQQHNKRSQSNVDFTVNEHWKVLEKSVNFTRGQMFPKVAKIPITVSSSFLIPNEDICSGFSALTYVVVVHSAVDHFERRLSMRKTWANQTIIFDSGISSRTVFILGSTNNWQLQDAVNEESRTFGDIVQGNFHDDYKNLTLKAVTGLRWVSQHCRHARFVIKVDDDVFVNMPYVIQLVFPLLSMNNREIVCSVEPNGRIFRIGNRNLNLKKWFLPDDYFKGLKRYPMPFCYGYATFFSSSLATELFEEAKSTPVFPLDDVYVYGILAHKLQGTRWRNAGSTFYKSEASALAALHESAVPVVLVGTAPTYHSMLAFWIETQNLLRQDVVRQSGV